MSGASPGVVAEKVFGVIFVCDFEDYSLWCQTVESASVAAFGKRFLGSAALLADLLGGAFLKSTGDGAIGVWAHELDEGDEDGTVPRKVEAVGRDVLRACFLAMALQVLAELGLGFGWPIPRQLRCAVHVGVVHRLTYTRFDKGVHIDFVGEALNAACRIEKLGSDVRGAVFSEHAYRILARSGRVLPTELPQRDVADLKSAQWLGKRVYGQPSASLLQRIRSLSPPDEDDRAAFEAKFRANGAAFMEALLFEFFRVLHEQAGRLVPELLPDWCRTLTPHARRVVSDPFVQFDRAFAEDMPAAVRAAWQRFQSEVAPEAPSYEALRQEAAAFIPLLEPEIQDVVRWLLQLDGSPKKRRKKSKS